MVDKDINKINLGFSVGDTFASRGQKLIYHGWLKKFEKLLLQTPLVPWSYLTSKIYHDLFWYPLIRIRRKNKILRGTDWGHLFNSYTTS